jgi:hypothetical protein
MTTKVVFFVLGFPFSPSSAPSLSSVAWIGIVCLHEPKVFFYWPDVSLWWWTV